MKISHGLVAAAIVIAIAAFGGAVAPAAAGPAIFADNYNYVTAYPLGASGDVAPIAITPDMIFPAGIARDGNGNIYVTNPSTNTISVYSADATGNVSPVEIIGGSKTRLANPTGIALDQLGKIYVLNSATATITVYSTFNFGVIGKTTLQNQAPIAIIAGPKTKLKQPVAIAVDASGDIYVANQAGGPVVPGGGLRQGTITAYAAGSNGDVAPTATIKGSATGLLYPVSIALDSNHDIYVGNTYTYVSNTFVQEPSITIFQAGSQGDANPTAVIGGTSTGLDYLSGLALDSSGNIYATGFTGKGIPTINVYPAGSNGNVAPISTISGPDTGLGSEFAMTVDSAGNLYVLNGEEVSIYSAGSSGDAAPSNTFTSSFTGIDDSSGIALDGAGNIYVANSYAGADFFTGSLSIYPAGSYATTAPTTVIEGDNTGLNYPQKVAVDARGEISVLNLNNTVTVYSAGSAGNVPPSATINLNGNINPTDIARGIDGQLYVANRGTVECNNNGHCYQTSPGAIDIYSAQANGNAKPEAAISGYLTGLASPSAIAVSQRGNIFVANQGPMDCSCGCSPTGDGSITVYAPGSAANAVPIATIQGPLTRLGLPDEIAVDSNENLYVVDGGAIGEAYSGPVGRSVGNCLGDGLAATGSRNRNLAGGSPAIDLVPGVNNLAPTSLDSLPDSILVLKAGSNGDTPPMAIIRGPFTALGGSAIAIGPSGP
jgi:hypothetical protein